MPVSRQRKKIFGMPANMHGMDRNERCRITAYARAYNHSHRKKGQQVGPITRAFQQVLQALVFSFANSKTGSCFPSYEALANRAECCVATAVAAVTALEEAGIIRVWTRLKRVGPRVERTSNAYTFRPIGFENSFQSRNSKNQEGSGVNKDWESTMVPRSGTAMVNAALDKFANALALPSPVDLQGFQLQPKPKVRPMYLSPAQLAAERAKLRR